MFDILTEEFLASISLESSLKVNLANYSMNKFDEKDLTKVITDLKTMQASYECELIKVLKSNHIALNLLIH